MLFGCGLTSKFILSKSTRVIWSVLVSDYRMKKQYCCKPYLLFITALQTDNDQHYVDLPSKTKYNRNWNRLPGEFILRIILPDYNVSIFLFMSNKVFFIFYLKML